MARGVGQRSFLAPARHAAVDEARVAGEAVVGPETEELIVAAAEELIALAGMQRVEIDSPIVIRLDGTNAEEGRAILAPNLSDKLMMEETMLDAARKAVELAS